MKSPNEIAEAYINVWNEPDRTRREKLIASGWTEGAIYVDSLMQATGRSEIAGSARNFLDQVPAQGTPVEQSGHLPLRFETGGGGPPCLGRAGGGRASAPRA